MEINLDNNASTSLDPFVLAVIQKSLLTPTANPSSVHRLGKQEREKLRQARLSVAQYFKVQPNQVIFTSGATESLNMLLKGYITPTFEGHIISSSAEHAAVFETLKKLQTTKCAVSFLQPTRFGAVTPELVKEALQPNTKLICLMAVNNETGVKTDLHAIGKIAQERKIPFFVDGVAWLGKEELEVPPGVSAMVFSGHKIHALKGMGCTILRTPLSLEPLIYGGDQEFSKRGGTENMLGILAFAEAIRQLPLTLPVATLHMEKLRNLFEQKIVQALANVTINGTGPRICNTSNLCFHGMDGESLLLQLDMQGIYASLGSACASGAIEPSRVLLNMGLSRTEAQSSLRFSLSRFTTEEEIERAVAAICKCVS